MSQNLITFEKALKENYLPVWRNQLGVEPSALLSKIKKPTLKANKIVASAPVGLSGGFGFGAEGAATPAAGGVRFERFETESIKTTLSSIPSKWQADMYGEPVYMNSR